MTIWKTSKQILFTPNSFHSSTSNCTGTIISVKHGKWHCRMRPSIKPSSRNNDNIPSRRSMESFIFRQTWSRSWQMLVCLMLHYNLCTRNSTLPASMEYWHWRHLQNQLVMIYRIPLENSLRSFSPEFISNCRNGKQSESQMMTYFSGRCKTTKQCESIFRMNDFFRSEGIHRLIARTRTRPRENEPVSQRYS